MRAMTFAAAFVGATFAVVTPCFAIETGQPPNLPPPPPPPLNTSAPATTSAPPPSRTTHPASSPPASSSATVTASGSTADSGATFNGGGALDTRWFIAPMLGFASEDSSLGIGVRGGKTLENHIYIGGTFVFQVGESVSYGSTATVNGTTVSSSGSASTNGFYLGPEAGYDFDLKAVVVRPYMGIGLFDVTGSGGGAGYSGSSSSTFFIIWPGCTVIWNVPNSNYFLGGDARLITIPGTAFGLYAMAGIHFGS